MTSDTPRSLPVAYVDIACGHCRTPLQLTDTRSHVCTRCLLDYGPDPFTEEPAQLHNVEPCGWTPGLPTGSPDTITVQHPCDLGAGHFGDHRYAEDTIVRKGAAWTAGVRDE